MVCEPGELKKDEPPYADARPYPSFEEANDRAWEIDPDDERKLFIWRRR